MSNSEHLWHHIVFDADHNLDSALVSLIGWTASREPKAIGTAFIIKANGNRAIAVTAAHNFTEGLKAIHTKVMAHPSALPEFLPDHTSLNREGVRAIYKSGQDVAACVLVAAAWDKKHDIAFIEIATQDPTDAAVFQNEFLVDDVLPEIGEEIGVIGYGGMGTYDEQRDHKGYEEFKFSRQLIVRTGRVTNIYPDGYPPIRGFCIETTIPIFGGMSGGPCFRMINFEKNLPIKPFALISRDVEAPDEIKSDTKNPGTSFHAALNCHVQKDADGKRHVTLILPEASLLKNSEYEKIS